ncbi:MAG: hypothetical protein HRU28_19060 [Rhizobiales bacterium]|nr:hypothetical protein [Hyphomicrobiales bacterium]
MNDNVDQETSLELSRRYLFMALKSIYSYNGHLDQTPSYVDTDMLVQISQEFHDASSAVDLIIHKALQNNVR